MRYQLAMPLVEDGIIRLPTLYKPPYYGSHRGWRHRGALEQGVYEAALWRAFRRRVALEGPAWPELRLAGWSLEDIARAAGKHHLIATWRRGDRE